MYIAMGVRIYICVHARIHVTMNNIITASLLWSTSNLLML